MPSRFIVFDIWGDYAHFRKYYTTSSPLSSSIPPRTAVIGLVSAIIGLDKDEYLKHMTKDQAHVSVRIINPVKKIRLGMNLINTKDGYWVPVKRGKHEPRTQIRFEFLKDPRYRIYFAHQDPGIHHTLKQNLIEHKSVYTPYLGISELIGEFSYIGEFTVVKGPNEGELSPVNTVLPLDKDVVLEAEFLEPGYKLFKERIPTEMIPGRVVTEYREVLYESEGKSIKAKVKEGFLLEGGDCIVLL